MLTKGPFTATHSIRDGLIVNRDKSKFSFSTGEADKLVQLIVTVMRVESYPALPSRLQVHPFECKFFPNKTMELYRNDKDGGIPFTFNEGDDLIWLVQQIRNVALESDRHHGSVSGFQPRNTPDPLF